MAFVEVNELLMPDEEISDVHVSKYNSTQGVLKEGSCKCSDEARVEGVDQGESKDR